MVCTELSFRDVLAKAPEPKYYTPHRLSPFVSGGVYVAYDVLIITTIPRDADEERNSLRNSKWPNNWRGSGIGKAGLVVVGIAFIAATIVQMEQFFTKSFHNTIKENFKGIPAVNSLYQTLP